MAPSVGDPHADAGFKAPGAPAPDFISSLDPAPISFRLCNQAGVAYAGG